MRTKIIAEVASCHNGDVELAKAMIKKASEIGVDIIKFQSWQARNVSDNDPDKSRYEALELSNENHYILKQECEKNGVEFLTTCYDEKRINFLKKLGLRKIKVASVDLRHFGFLKRIRDSFEEVIVSTGMSTKDEILKAVNILRKGKYTIMHCVSIYPCPLEKANLKKIDWLQTIAKSVGYSDHTHGITAAVFALAKGVDYIEKHFTLDRNMPQTPHSMGNGLNPITTHSIADEPPVFKEICQWRDNYEIARGNGSFVLYPEEKLVRRKYEGRLGTNK